MILRHFNLKKYPTAFIKLTGLEATQFDALVSELLPVFTAARLKRFNRANRRRSVGGGNHCELELCDQVLLTVVWLHKYPHQELLGYFFGVSRPTVWRYIKQVSP